MGKELVEAIISAILSTLILTYLYKGYEKRKFYFAGFVLSIVLLGISIIWGERFCNNNGVRIVINSFVYLINGYMMYSIPQLIKYIQQTIIMFVSANVADALLILPILIIKNSNNLIFLEKFERWLLLLIVSRSLCFVIIFALKKLGFIDKKENKKCGRFIIAVFAGVYLYILYLSKIVFDKEYQVKDFLLLIFITTSLVIILSMSFFILGKQSEERVLVQKELDILKEKNRYEMDAYKKKRKMEVELQKMYHDIKNMELLVSAYRETGINLEQMDTYIKKMKEYFLIADSKSTGNEILDIFLCEKRKECEKKNIQLFYKVDFSQGNFIHTVDMGTIFGNILNNAKEACEKLYELEKRKIILQVSNYEKFIVIRCSNPVAEIKKEKGKLMTTKKDKGNHGFGLICLEEVLETYGGQYSYEVKSGTFYATVFIPIPNIEF